jgi:DMSO reductase family type II enzyme heme b subunit
MPSFSDAYSEEQRWGLTYYLRSLQLERKLNNIIILNNVDKIPSSPEDDTWDKANYIDIKMEGKKVFGISLISAITNMRIRGLYTDSDVALMLEWIDKKPDKGDDELPPDALRVIFPAGRNLLNVWSWKASDNRAVEFTSSGQEMNALTSQEKTDVEAKSSYKNGIYRVIFKRRINSRDKNDTKFSVNKRIPFSIIAYDGKNNEQGNRGAMSAVRYMVMQKSGS